MQRQGTSNDTHHHQITASPCGGTLVPETPSPRSAFAHWTFVLMANKGDGHVCGRREAAPRHCRSVTPSWRRERCPSGRREMAAGWGPSPSCLPLSEPCSQGSSGDGPRRCSRCFQRAELEHLITQNTSPTNPCLYIKASSCPSLSLSASFSCSILSENVFLPPSFSLFHFQSSAVLCPAGHSQRDHFHTNLSRV